MVPNLQGDHFCSIPWIFYKNGPPGPICRGGPFLSKQFNSERCYVCFDTMFGCSHVVTIHISGLPLLIIEIENYLRYYNGL